MLARRIALTTALAVLPPIFAGCGSPSAANISLRKDLQQRDDTIAQLKRQHIADQADIKAKRGPATTSLAGDTLATIYTVHGLKLGRLTGAANLNSKVDGNDGLKVEATPTDDDGQALKATGTFDVSAFDLNASGARIGHWMFDDAAARANWFGSALLYSYVLPCPWQTLPTHSDITLRVSFTDTLTGRKFTEQKQIHLTAPATAPASQP